MPELKTAVCRPQTPTIAEYTLAERLGRGGMAEVFRGTRVTDGEPVAVKILSVISENPEDFVNRFEREVKLLYALEHPNILKIFASGKTGDNRPYLVMEHLPCQDLRRHLIANDPWPTEKVLPFLNEVAQALNYLHKQGIIHRDLKPENILLRENGSPVLADFGVALPDWEIGMLTRTGECIGSWGYAAPEQQQGRDVDARADQFALAAIAYELFTGHRPLGVFSLPSQLNPKIPSSLDSVLRRALSQNPTDRYENITEFVAAVNLAIADPQRETRQKRRRVLVGLCIPAILVLGVFGFCAYFPERSPLFADGPLELVDGKNSVGMTFAYIGPGTFVMGGLDGDPNSDKAEYPRQKVTISKGFYLGKTEVTVGQFRQFVEETGYVTEADREGGGFCYVCTMTDWKRELGTSWKNPIPNRPTFDDYPVTQVSWEDAVAFCKWLSTKEGVTYRLPTEAEWEYACRAGTTTRFTHGDEIKDVKKYGWSADNAQSGPRAVGQLEANPWGLYDMQGNVFEWCLDSIGDYSGEDQTDPRPDNGRLKAVRGGSFQYVPEATRSSARMSYYLDVPNHDCGFRVLREIK